MDRNRNNLRRQSMINNALNVAATPARRGLPSDPDESGDFGEASRMDRTPLRRSLAPKTPVQTLRDVDDEGERERRRSDVAMERRMSNITPGSDISPLAQMNKIVGDREIKEHLQICIKLNNENKITSKNAWQLHIIDMIAQISNKEASNTLQVAATSLDIGAKIYAYRVDDAHARVLQLANSLTQKGGNRASNDDGSDNEAGGDLSGEEAQQQQSDKAKRKKRQKKPLRMVNGKKPTIEYNQEALRAPLNMIDHSFFNTQEDIDVGASDNLFTCKQIVNPSTHLSTLLTNQKYWARDPDELLREAALDLDAFKDLLPRVDVDKLSICECVEKIAIGEWNAEEDEDFANELVLDDAGFPMAELDGSVHDIFDNDPPDADANGTDRDDLPSVHGDDDDDPDADKENEQFQRRMFGGLARIEAAVPEPNDYGYNVLLRTSHGRIINKVWAGPSHWKVKFVRPSPARFSGTASTVVDVAAQGRARRSRRPPPEEVKLDFGQLKEWPEERFPIMKRKRTIPASAEDKIMNLEVYPQAETFAKRCHELLSKPGARPPPLKRDARQQDGDEDEVNVVPYNYENLNDSEYCSQNGALDDFGGGDGDNSNHTVEENVIAAHHQNFLDNLVDMPEQAAHNEMHYALKAKKMDMKKLKNAEWTIITRKTGREVKETRFLDLYEQLPAFLTVDMRKELSVHLAFAALLHLCNDHQLALERSDRQINDFFIKEA